jgi:hypothetical protein
LKFFKQPATGGLMKELAKNRWIRVGSLTSSLGFVFGTVVVVSQDWFF